ncbi:MAG: hypothetical protein Fur0010_21600 [Bdellovibrio sp.]
MLIFLFNFFISILFANASDQLCGIETKAESTVFHCKDFSTNTSTSREFPALLETEIQKGLEDKGVRVVPMEEYVARTLNSDLELIAIGPSDAVVSCLREIESEHKILYTTREFNALGSDHPTIERLKRLADALHNAGVCKLPVVRQTFNNIDIESSDDLLHHFLCISNSESTFGRDNLGQGGRGPWGIHPMHNQEAGTTAFVDGRNITLTRDGVCLGLQSVVRDRNGAEIRNNSSYTRQEVINDNALCAMRLYQLPNGKGGIRGFSDWGTTSRWGSNRHCSKNTRDRLQFIKYLGTKGCCSQACIQRVEGTL